MKKKLLLSVAFFGAAAGVGSPALAAPPTPLPMMYNWTGCYIGANAGYSWGRASADVNAPSLGFPFGANFDMNGFIGGGQVGCNWQYSNAVWGLETDFQGSAQKGSRFAAFNFSEGTSSHNIEAKLRWFGTVRARAGVLVVPTVLLYGTGGLAYGNVQVTDTFSLATLARPHSAAQIPALAGPWASASKACLSMRHNGRGELNTFTWTLGRLTGPV